MKRLFLIKRIDPRCEQCRGQILAMVVCVSNKSQAEALAFKHIVLNQQGKLHLQHDGKPLTADCIEYVDLGVARSDISPGIILSQQAGI